MLNFKKYSGSINHIKIEKKVWKLLGRKSFLHLEVGAPNLAVDWTPATFMLED